MQSALERRQQIIEAISDRRQDTGCTSEQAKRRIIYGFGGSVVFGIKKNEPVFTYYSKQGLWFG